MDNIIGRPEYEKIVYGMLLPYKPLDMDMRDFELSVDHLMEYMFRQKVNLATREVEYLLGFSKIEALGFMFNRDKELDDVDNQFSNYLLNIAEQLLHFIGASLKQFEIQRRVPTTMLTLPDVLFRCHHVGTYLFDAKVESNDTKSTMRFYSEPKYGQFAEYSLIQN